MFVSVTIGGLNTGDLWPNAVLINLFYVHFANDSFYCAYFEQTLYNENCTADPIDCRFDQFFTTFTMVRHSQSVFYLFMYDEKLNRVLGAKRYPDEDDYDDKVSGKVVIMNYDGQCRHDRLYNVSTRTRIPEHNNSLIVNYNNCSYTPRDRVWYLKSREIGVGRAIWTEPYLFFGSKDLYGISYVAPIDWKGRRLTFVLGVTMGTLFLSAPHDVIRMPQGSVWMVVTPGLDIVTSSNGDTFIEGTWSCRHMRLGTVGIWFDISFLLK